MSIGWIIVVLLISHLLVYALGVLCGWYTTLRRNWFLWKTGSPEHDRMTLMEFRRRNLEKHQ